MVLESLFNSLNLRVVPARRHLNSECRKFSIPSLRHKAVEMSENMDENFEVGDFVFAKVKGHLHWPATISQIETVHANGYERTKYNVYFYGSHEMSMVKVDSIFKFEDHYNYLKQKYANNSKFIAALVELEADLETRKSYLKSLRECFVDSGRLDDLQNRHEDEMFTASDYSERDTVAVLSDQHSNEVSSGFNESFDSDEEDEIRKEQKYEIISMEKVMFPGVSDIFLIISLGFNEEDLQEDYECIKNELRMMQCYVKLERLPRNLERIFGAKQVKAPTLSPIKETPHPYKPGVFIKKRKRRKWRKHFVEKELTRQLNVTKPSLTYKAAEALKRRRQHRRQKFFRDENRLLTLRQRNTGASQDENTSDCLCPPEECNCNVEQSTSHITCPICQAQFTSSLDFKQHSFNIHIMGL